MSDLKTIDSSELKTVSKSLCAGEKILLSGVVYTARDAAHKRIFELIKSNAAFLLPFNIDGAVIYYAGPTPAPDHLPIGSCGPTTSSRMDIYSPDLLDMGLAGMIGKGERSVPVIDAIKRNSAVYLCAVGGAGALACKSIISCEEIGFADLGCESVKRLVFDKFPLFVGIDAAGGNIFCRE